MYNIKNTDDLDAAINMLENEIDEQKIMLAGHLKSVYQKFKPVNIARDIFKEAATSGEFRGNILSTLLGISAGYVINKIFFRRNSNPLKSLLGNILQYGISSFVIHPSGILKNFLSPRMKLSARAEGEERSGQAEYADIE
jgi:hypothetical protein